MVETVRRWWFERQSAWRHRDPGEGPQREFSGPRPTKLIAAKGLSATC